MNNLSWMIYFIDVFQTIVRWSIFATIASAISLSASFIMISICIDDCSKRKEIEKIERYQQTRLKFVKICLPILIVSIIISTVIPSRQTLILISASEIGEKIINSDNTKAIIDPSVNLLKGWIRKELDKLNKESDK